MSKVTRDQLKTWFRKGLYPLESQFHAWIDSYWHKDDTLPVTAVDNLATLLNGKADAVLLDSKQDKIDAALETESKSIVGAINELSGKTGEVSEAGGIRYVNEDVPDIQNVQAALDDIYGKIAGIGTCEAIAEEDIQNLFNGNL